MELLSVNVSRIRSVDGSKPTGHYKEPVCGPTPVGRLGVAGDQQANQRYHGGADQAVYLYSQEDYQWWSEQLGRSLGPGTFGENLTLSHFAEPVRIGDRVKIGEVELEVSAPRIPCSTLAGRMGDPGFVKRFARAERPGYYARVVRQGALELGPVRWSSSEHVSGLEVFRLLLGQRDPALVEMALQAPLAERIRESLEARPKGGPTNVSA